jgi:hypothetical protein
VKYIFLPPWFIGFHTFYTPLISKEAIMAINLHCINCKSSCSLKLKSCPKCGYDFSRGRKYGVSIRLYNGKRITKVISSISKAKKYEGKLKSQVLDKNLFGITKAPLIDNIWKEYLNYAKDNKRSWMDDESRWEHHIKPRLKGKKMDQIIPLDIQKVISGMKNKRDYAPATIKQVLALVKRLYK